MTVNQQKGEVPHGERLLESPSMVILLIFVLTGFIVLLVAVIMGGHKVKGEISGLKAHSPEEFSYINWDEPMMKELTEPVSEEKGKKEKSFIVPPPPFSSEDIFPCSECHADMEVNETRRKLEDYHEDIKLNHGPKDRWCFDCHNPKDRDKLRLANGKLIDFTESYRLCGQCHGTIYRDWRKGIHGKRRGFWNGRKSYYLCPSCHNPHSPRFKPIKPLPPPVRPGLLRSEAMKGD